MSGTLSSLVAVVAICVTTVQGMLPGSFGASPGGLGLGMAIGNIELSANDYMALDNAVKYIVDPTASPSPALIMLAAQQGSVPSSAAKMMSFLIPLQAMARERKISVPGVVGQATDMQIDNHIMKKSLKWMQERAMMGTMIENPDFMMRMQNQVQRKAAPTATGASTVANASPAANTNAQVATQPSMGAQQQTGIESYLANVLPMMALGFENVLV